MKEFKRDIALILIIFTLGVLLGFSLSTKLTNSKLDSLKKQVAKTNCLTEPINIECFKSTIEKHKIKFSHIVLAQAILESNNFKSQLFKRNLNCFGMKIPSMRLSFAENAYDWGNYAKYASLEDCIKDYKSWQVSNCYNIFTEEAYFELLSSIYAENKNYCLTLKQIIKKL